MINACMNVERASCLFMSNIRWEMGAGGKSKELGICLLHFLERVHVGNVKRDVGSQEYGRLYY